MVIRCPKCGAKRQGATPPPEVIATIICRCRQCGAEFTVNPPWPEDRETMTEAVMREAWRNVRQLDYLHDGPLSTTTIDEVLR